MTWGPPRKVAGVRILHLQGDNGIYAQCKNLVERRRRVPLAVWRTLPNLVQCKLCFRSQRGHVSATESQIIAVEVMLHGLAEVFGR